MTGALPAVDGRFMMETTAALCRIPSPTGYTAVAVAYVEDRFTELGLEVRRTVKGSLVATLPGSADHASGGRLLSAHVDTLGAMVKEIKKNGRLRLTLIGGYDWSTIEGEYCTVHTAAGAAVTGTILTTKASYHIHGKALVELKRDEAPETVELQALKYAAFCSRFTPETLVEEYRSWLTPVYEGAAPPSGAGTGSPATSEPPSEPA